MQDSEIIKLYWERNENAISETDKIYGKYCNAISFNILQNYEDSEECVNDTYIKLWNSIPTQKPNIFKAYIAKIVRNLSLNKYEKRRSKKRNAILEVALEELDECVPSNVSIENEIIYNEFLKKINNFLEQLSEINRKIFLERYWYIYSINDIAKRNKITVSNVKTTLFRIRSELKKYIDGCEFYE